MADDDKTLPEETDTRERMATLSRAMADAARVKGEGKHETAHGARHSVPIDEVERIIEDWPHAPREVAQQMLAKYGPPNEATPTKLFWYENGPWKRSELTSDIGVHDFPAPHADFLTQYIDYRVPVDKFDYIGRFDGSCLVDRTMGEAAARCDSEAANTLTLNLMHDIVTGKRTVEDARKTYADNMVGYTIGRDAPYAERLLFDVPRGGTEDADESIMKAIPEQLAGKVKDMVTGGEEVTEDRGTGLGTEATR